MTLSFSKMRGGVGNGRRWHVLESWDPGVMGGGKHRMQDSESTDTLLQRLTILLWSLHCLLNNRNRC